MDAKKRLTRAIIVGDLQHKTLTAVSPLQKTSQDTVTFKFPRMKRLTGKPFRLYNNRR